MLFSVVAYFYGRVVQTISTQFNQHWTCCHAHVAHAAHLNGPVVIRTHFDTVLQLQSQIHQGTSVREWNWLRKNHAGWL